MNGGTGYSVDVLEVMAAAVVTLAVGFGVGAVIARWWIVAVPFALAVAWVVVTAIGGEKDSDGAYEWHWALLFGGIFALVAAPALAAGVAVRRRRSTRH